MTKDNFIKENVEFNQSSGNNPKIPTEDTADPFFVFPTQNMIDVAKQKIALRIETHIETAFLLTLVEKKEPKKQLSSQWKRHIMAIALLMLGIAGISANTIYGNYSANKIERTTQAALKKNKKRTC